MYYSWENCIVVNFGIHLFVVNQNSVDDSLGCTECIDETRCVRAVFKLKKHRFGKFKMVFYDFYVVYAKIMALGAVLKKNVNLLFICLHCFKLHFSRIDRHIVEAVILFQDP